LRQLAIYCSVPTALHEIRPSGLFLTDFIGEARDDAQAVEVQQFSRQPRRMASAWATASSSFVARTTTAGPMSRPFSSKTKSRYRFMAAQSKNAGLTSLKTPYARNPIQAKLTIAAAARPATGQTRLKNEIDCATIGRSEVKIRGGIATTWFSRLVLPGLCGKACSVSDLETTRLFKSV
jgi:hypothetical protein